MFNKIYQSDRDFVLFDVLISHSHLLIRSQKRGDYQTNIDIIFSGFRYMQMFHSLHGIKISRVKKAPALADYPDVNKALEIDNVHIFEIESNNVKYYIIASGVYVCENSYEFCESSLYKHEGPNKIIASSDKKWGLF